MKMIVAVDSKNGIAKNGKIPWNCPEDMEFFKFITIGHPVIMGRKTFETLKRPLPFRDNLIIGSDHWAPDHFKGNQDYNDAFIIGGESIYKEFIHHVDIIYVSRINGDYECDQHFVSIPTSFANVQQLKLSDNCIVHKYVKWVNRPESDKKLLLESINKQLNIQELKSNHI